MAASSLINIATVLTAAAMLISPSISLDTCTSQKFKTQKEFQDCFDLPALGSSLHYTYNSTNSSLSIAYVGVPVKSDGWVAWAINPTSTGMSGAQTLATFKSDGKLIVKTYNIKSVGPITESKLTIDAWDLGTESVGNKMVIFASVKVPEKEEQINHVWQSGVSVTDGVPDGHAVDAAHLSSKGVLKLTGGNGKNTSPSPSSTPSTPGAADKLSGASAIRMMNLGSCLGVIVLIASFVGF